MSSRFFTRNDQVCRPGPRQGRGPTWSIPQTHVGRDPGHGENDQFGETGTVLPEERIEGGHWSGPTLTVRARFEQLKQLAAKVEIPVYGEPGNKKPEDIAKHGIDHYRKEKTDLVIIDTAGRHRNERDLMDEMKRIASAVKPDEIVLAIDATIGQQAITQARAFHEATPVGPCS